MKRTMVALVLAGLSLAACGGDDDTSAEDEASAGEEVEAEEATETSAPAGDDADEGVGETTAPAGDDDAAGSGDSIVPGEDLNICEMFTADELQPFVNFALEPGDPFFSGVDENSCDWAPPVGDPTLGTISIRLAGAGSFVLLDSNAFPIDGLGESAEVEGQYGLTNVHIGDIVVTFQVTYNELAHPDIAAAHPEIVVADDLFATVNDAHASLALAQAFADRFGG